MKSLLALLGAISLVVSSAHAALIYQTQNFSNVTGGSLLTWNQFDSSLGTLTSIVFTLNGSVTGSFNVNNTDFFTDLNISSPNARLALTFSGGGSPSPLQGTAASFATSPGTTAASPFLLQEQQSQVFNVDPAPSNLTPFTSANLIASSVYFTGGSTFNTTILRIPGVTLIGGSSTQDFSSLLAQGTAGLTYEYTPNAVIPEPGTWAAAALLIGAAGYMRWRKRAKVS